MSQEANDRRRFQRIATDKPVLVRSGDAQHAGSVLDISLRGLLFELHGDWRPGCGTLVQASVRLDEQTPAIRMDGNVAHVQDGRIGIRCTGIDLESASMLRRMLELNLDDSAMLERDLAQLIAD
jgi:hypothetical protein